MSWGAKARNTCKHVFHHSPSHTWDTRLGMFNLGSHCLCSALSARQQHYIHSLHPYRALQPTCVCGEGGGGGGLTVDLNIDTYVREQGTHTFL